MTLEEYYLKGKALNGTSDMSAWKLKHPVSGQPFKMKDLFLEGVNIRLLQDYFESTNSGVEIIDGDGNKYREFELWEEETT